MTRFYCTYFDHRYLAKGVAMIRSLRRHVPDARVWALCLSSEAEHILRETAEPGVRTIALADFERGDTELAAAKSDGRRTVEYYFTLTPSLIRYVMDKAPDAEMVTYLDGDMWFLSDPEPVYREMGDASVLIIPHGFAPRMRHLERFGIFNVGWLTFRNDARGRACGEWWRQRTNEWCFDRVDNGRFCEQGYLDQFSRLFDGVHVLAHRGANLAPWNVAASIVTSRGGTLYAGDDPVLFFHFHGLKRLESEEYLTSHGLYRADLSPLVRDALYRPYIAEVAAIEQGIETRFGPMDRSSVRELHGGGETALTRAKRRLKLAIARRKGLTVHAPKLADGGRR
jgi:hypothetical protein